MTEIKWKYFEKFDDKNIDNLESEIGNKMPADYKVLLVECNGAKPNPHQFDIHGRKGCVVDYMLSVNIILKTIKNMRDSGKELVPIAIDPFGNYIAYNYSSSKENPEIVFWDHETNTTTFIARNFKTFISLLY